MLEKLLEIEKQMDTVLDQVALVYANLLDFENFEKQFRKCIDNKSQGVIFWYKSPMLPEKSAIMKDSGVSGVNYNCRCNCSISFELMHFIMTGEAVNTNISNGNTLLRKHCNRKLDVLIC